MFAHMGRVGRILEQEPEIKKRHPTRCTEHYAALRLMEVRGLESFRVQPGGLARPACVGKLDGVILSSNLISTALNID
jgi:hypothetical protein